MFSHALVRDGSRSTARLKLDSASLNIPCLYRATPSSRACWPGDRPQAGAFAASAIATKADNRFTMSPARSAGGFASGASRARGPRPSSAVPHPVAPPSGRSGRRPTPRARSAPEASRIQASVARSGRDPAATATVGTMSQSVAPAQNSEQIPDRRSIRGSSSRRAGPTAGSAPRSARRRRSARRPRGLRAPWRRPEPDTRT